MLEKVLGNIYPMKRVIAIVVGSGVATSAALYAASIQPAIPTMSDEWQAATKDYRKYQKMDDVYSSK